MRANGTKGVSPLSLPQRKRQPGRRGCKRLLLSAAALTAIVSLAVFLPAHATVVPDLQRELQAEHVRGQGKQVEAASPSLPLGINILVAVKCSWCLHFEGSIPCSLGGQPLGCNYLNASMLPPSRADALLFHTPQLMPSLLAKYSKQYAEKPFIAMSREPSIYFPWQANPEYMSHFKYKMRYHLDADVPYVYQAYDIRAPQKVALPSFEERKGAVLYAARRCLVPSGRNEVVQFLMTEGQVPVDAMGPCLHNRPEHPRGEALSPRQGLPGEDWVRGKLRWARYYRACVAMENSVERDYVTEKVWHAFEAGCVPLFRGAPNAADFLPSRDSVIWTDDFQRLEDLAEEVKRVLTNKAHFEKYMAWRARPYEQLSEGYRNFVQLSKGSPKCRMCQILAEKERTGLREGGAQIGASNVQR